MPQKQSKNRKLGRNKAKCEKYRAQGRREKNKELHSNTRKERFRKRLAARRAANPDYLTDRERWEARRAASGHFED